MNTFAVVAADYFCRGWQILPLFSGKGVTPKGFTGYEGRLPSDEDVDRWSKEPGVTGVCLRLVDMVGLDLDAYDPDKKASESWEKLRDKLGPLPPTWVSSSRVAGEDYDGLSGIRLFGLPPEYAARQGERCWKGNLGPGIDVVRFAHRQVNAYPTVHKRGTRYQWFDETTGEIVAGVLPVRPADIPVLPEAWCEFLLKPSPKPKSRRERRPRQNKRVRHARVATEDSVALADCWTEGETCNAVRAALRSTLSALAGGRHDESLRGVLRLTRLGEQGHQGVRQAVEMLREEFLRQVTEDESRAPAEAASEWDRAVGGVMAEIARDGFTAPEDRGCCGPHPGSIVSVDITRDDLFFSSTRVLAHIRQAAQSRMLEPWAVLGAALACVVAEVPPWVVLPATVGSVASLNLAVLLVADSSGGKSTAHACARELLVGATAKMVGTPSGEGIIQTFLRWDKDKHANVVVDDPRAMMFVDEIGQVAAITSRSGSTFGSTFRSAISGSSMGNQNAAADRRRNLPPHSYRWTAVCGGQPHLTDVLLNQTEVDAGTPQRWLFLRAKPVVLPDVEPEWPGPLTWTPPVFKPQEAGRYAVVGLPGSVQRYVKAQRRKSLLNDADAVNGHLVLTRLKVATGLAWLHGERDVTEQWWDLGGIVVEESCAVRDGCLEELARLHAESDRAKGRSDARRAAGAREGLGEEIEKYAKLLAKVVAQGDHSNAKHSPDQGCTGRCLTHGLRNHRGADREAALARALDLDWIEQRGDRYFRGESWPW